ncbi:kinase domain protein, putative (macronuclear) [Tetrahymena thermophila SB210]|uniref:Kinase domain protein, putative n=1 Tax=Tetrahymena thermophila (strain SB210) TaxID=312017 RepID=Q23TB6_TETTS|nr:kinase domain protein, putative [Tetrahymena thermophila SB210]EAR99790.2 kinase domain protein, putative [Tetrahymena thermophila SB210]|eukprot:XP_001020035.2 kinase domain protein, putative [Tetrahymena thermophila SB210]
MEQVKLKNLNQDKENQLDLDENEQVFYTYQLNQGNYHLAKVIKVDKSYCNVNFPAAQNLKNIISSCINLLDLSLNLSFCQLDTDCAIEVGRGIGKCSQLNNLLLNLNCNSIKTQGAVNIVSQIAKCSHLQKLRYQISKNQIGYNYNYNSIGEIQTMNLQIAQIWLNGNVLQTKDLNFLGSCLSKCESLKRLELFLNQNDLNNAADFFEKLSLCRNISFLTLHLANNSLGNLIAELFSQTIQKFDFLKFLDLDLRYNSINYEGFDFIFKECSKKKYLNFIKVSLNLKKLNEFEILRIKYLLSKPRRLVSFQVV